MTWRTIVLGLVTALAALAAERPLNVLFIAVDDLRPELGCYGSEQAKSPNIDRLAAQGVRFEHHYVQVATCGASRFALLTGRSPAHSGAMGNGAFRQLPRGGEVAARSMPELFRRNGYKTICIGKMSHSPDGREFAYNGKGDGRMELPDAWDELPTPFGDWKRGWGTFFAYAGGRHREDGSGFRPVMQFEVERDNELPDGMMADVAIARLGELAKTEQPFFMGLGFFKPHLPFVAPKQDWEASTGDLPAVSKSLDNKYAKSSGEFFGYHRNERGRDLTDESVASYRRAYRACVRYVDRQVGKVLAALEASGQAERTVVVLWGDHGWDLGEQGLWGKHKPLERSTRSPLIIRVPGVTPRAITAPVETIDVYPTLVELCGLKETATLSPLDGISLYPVLRGQRDAIRDHAVSYWGKCVAVRRGQYRLLAERPNSKAPLEASALYKISNGDEAAGPNLLNSQPELAAQMLQIARERTRTR